MVLDGVSKPQNFGALGLPGVILGLAALPAYPRTKTVSVKLRPAEVENVRKLLEESTAGEHTNPGRQSSAQGGTGGEDGTIKISIPKLGLRMYPYRRATARSS